MVKFKQKLYSEYSAMRYLYVELKKRLQNNYNPNNREVPVVDSNSIVPVLKGNNIVVEKFMITTSMFGKDKYRMYIKIGAKIPLPNKFRLPSRVERKNLGNMRLSLKGNVSSGGGGNNKNKGGNGGGGNGLLTSEYSPNIDLGYESTKLMGEVVNYNKVRRELILEFDDINSAILSLDVLPLGINYRYFILDPK